MARASLRIAALALALLGGCGRSTLMGDDDGWGCVGDECPELPDLAGCEGAGCFPVDLRGDGPADLGDLRFPDMLPPPPDLFVPCRQRPEQCTNKQDDNCDNRIDCKDPQCTGHSACVVLGQEICNNGLDDDENGLVDCDDPFCALFPGCDLPTCDPNNPDCSDPACVDEPACQNLVCKPTVDFGTLQPFDSTSRRMVATNGTKDVAVTPCAAPGGGMVVTEFTVAADNTSVRLDFVQLDPRGLITPDHVFGLFRAGVNQKCEANPVDCYDPEAAASGSRTFILEKGHYYLIVQAFTATHQGTVDVTLSTPPKGVPEVCNNGVDDDKNGLVDCADPRCLADPACQAAQCPLDDNVGVLLVEDPMNYVGKTIRFNPKGHGAENTINCGGKGDDYVVAFSLKETAGVGMDFTQAGDHLIGIFRRPPPGQACDAQALGCTDPGMQSWRIAWGEYPPGDYLFIFKALKPGDEGDIDVTLYAYRNRKVELCRNFIDDDGNGLVDCADPACFADASCGSPICMPDVDFGVFQIGDRRQARLDITTGHLNESVSCARGGGKSRVVKVTLAQPAGLGFSCNQSGQQVLGLFSEAGPRDGCDETELSCADPMVLPFQCDFIMPNLQAGAYYVIVQAFQAGTEGTVNLTLYAVDDRTLEVCNNKIDDDADGFTDCADRKCATSPYCSKLACMADETVDPMPTNGTAIQKFVDTTGRQPDAQPPCQVKPGGGTAVVYVNLPSKATLKAEYAQGFMSDHVFAVYPIPTTGLICEAEMPVGCVASNGALSGTATFTDLPQGKYWFIVAAAQPGTEGPVFLKFTASP